jgi:hypothetical protein
MNKHGNYRKYNDRSHNSSTYHKKDGTPMRSKLHQEAEKEIEEANQCDGCKMGFPIENGIHVDPSRSDYNHFHMVCTKST